MYLKHLNQTNRTMNVTIEHVFCRYSDEAEEIYFRIMNTILFATDETELRASMERLKNETSLDEYFIFGYGAHHIWINQRRPSDKKQNFQKSDYGSPFLTGTGKRPPMYFCGLNRNCQFQPVSFSLGRHAGAIPFLSS